MKICPRKWGAIKIYGLMSSKFDRAEREESNKIADFAGKVNTVGHARKQHILETPQRRIQGVGGRACPPSPVHPKKEEEKEKKEKKRENAC